MSNDASMLSQALAPDVSTDPLDHLLPPAEARELLRRAQQHEDRALTQLYTMFSERVFRFIYYRIQDRPRAEDLTNEVFVRMLESIEKFRPSGDDVALVLTSWIFTIARNLIIDDTRRQKIRVAEQLTDGDEELRDETFDLDVHLTRAALQNALAQLTEEQQTVLLLRFEDGFTSAQIGKMMGKTEMAIKALQRRGLAAMARALGGDKSVFAKDTV